MRKKVNIQNRLNVFVISAPSGTGKTTICEKLLQRDKKLRRVITVTTRKPRQGEQNGRDYFFTTQRAFKERIKKKDFLEYAFVHGQLYGTPKSELKKCFRLHKDAVLVIDVQGGLQVKKAVPGAILIFLKPPSMSALRKRLSRRALDSKEAIERRLKNSVKELTQAPRYTYQVTNDKLPRAVKKLINIIKKERDK